MTLLRKSSPLLLMAMFTVMGALLGAASSHVVIPSPSSAFAQTSSSLAQDIVDLAQQEETDQSLSSSAADDDTQTDTNTQSFGLDLDQDVEAEVEQEAEQVAGNLVALQDQEEQEDTTPPALTVPEDITEEATSSDGVVVRFEVTAEDNVDGTVPVECTPESGSTFPIGVTTVECTATDAAGNIGRASFTVTVNPIESPRDNGKIVFTKRANIDSNANIYVMNADGSEQTRLTFSREEDSEPDWSPDGTKIAFNSDRDGKVQIFVINADGSELTRLTNNDVSERNPSWSPDGTKIAFNSIAFNSNGDPIGEIFVINADGSELTRLTNNDVNEGEPDWSPDGTKIAFNINIGDDSEIYVINAADGSELTRLTNNDVPDFDPSWSPDGTKIAFTRGTSSGPSTNEIYVMNADGSEQTRLTDNGVPDTQPTWSPDGTKIAFISTRTLSSGQFFDTPQIFVMNADGSEQRNIVNDESPARYRAPDWGPATDTD